MDKKFRVFCYWNGATRVNEAFDTLEEALEHKESHKDEEWGRCVYLDISDFFPTNDEGAHFKAPDTVTLYNEGGYNCTNFTFDEVINFMKAIGKKVE